MDYIKKITTKLQKKRLSSLKKAFKRGMQLSQEQADELNATLNKNLERAHEHKIDCVINCVQKLIEQYLKDNPRTIITMAQKALKNIAEHSDAELSAHPIDAKFLEAVLRNITIIKDDNLERGSLVIKANKSIIDAQISTQLERARDVLLA